MRAVNLVPAEQRQTGLDLAGRSGGVAPMIVVLLVGLAVLAFMYGGAKHSESKSKTELAAVNAELSAARAQVGRLAPYTSFIAMANQRIQYVSQLVAARFDWSHAFHELGRVLPRDVSLRSLQGQVATGSGAGRVTDASAAASSGATPTSATPPGSIPKFAISGCASSQSEVAQALQRLRLMDGVAEVDLQSSTKASNAGASSGGPSGPSGGCGGATFSAQITFNGLPSAPPTNVPSSAGGRGTAAASSASTPATQQVASRGNGR